MKGDSRVEGLEAGQGGEIRGEVCRCTTSHRTPGAAPHEGGLRHILFHSCHFENVPNN